jgi:NitT/TauT family transport system permease protein
MATNPLQKRPEEALIMTISQSLSRVLPEAARQSPAPQARRRVRRLPVQKSWPAWQVITVQISLLVGLIAAWEIAARTGLISAFFWSQPSAVAHSLVVFFTQGKALIDISTTFEETILGFILGTTFGSIIGMSFWWSRNWAAVVQPFIICFESIPKLALAPLVILVFGMGLPSKIAIATALTIIVTILTTASGVKAVDKDSEKLFYSLGATRLQVFLKLVIPSCIPWIISILRVNIGLALTGAVVGEFIASENGLGREIFYAGSIYDIALVWVAVLVLSMLSITMYAAVSWLERVLRKGVVH